MIHHILLIKMLKFQFIRMISYMVKKQKQQKLTKKQQELANKYNE